MVAFDTNTSSGTEPWRANGDDGMLAEETAPPSPAPPSSPGGRASGSIHWEPASVPLRYSDRPMPLGTRMFGLGGTALVCLALLGAALLKWATPPTVIVPTTLSTFDVAPPQAPPAPDTDIPPGPEQVQKEERPKVEVVEMPPPLVQMPATSSMSAPVADPAPDPGPPVERTTAPESSPKPPGAKSSDAKPTWEGQVFAALNAAKRYPLEARRNRQQGTPWVRFTMDRTGRVRSVRLVRSSGFDALDREAEALPTRASPLPAPPDSVEGDRIELTVPVEFFM